MGMRQTILLAAAMISAAILMASLISKAHASPEQRACPSLAHTVNLHTSQPMGDPQLVLHAQRGCAAMRERCVPADASEYDLRAFMRAFFYDYGVRG